MSARAWRVAVFAFLGAIAVRMLASTWRFRAYNAAAWRALYDNKRAFVLAVWHGDMLAPIWAHRKHGLVALVSKHSDGEIIARVIADLGLDAARGSTTRGGSRALLGLIRALDDGRIAAFTPDGPRGPRHVMQAGLVAASKRANAPVVLIGVAATRAWRFRSWDQFVLPKPFATIHLVYTDPVQVTSTADPATELPRFQAAMDAAVARAQQALQS